MNLSLSSFVGRALLVVNSTSSRLVLSSLDSDTTTELGRDNMTLCLLEGNYLGCLGCIHSIFSTRKLFWFFSNQISRPNLSHSLHSFLVVFSRHSFNVLFLLNWTCLLSLCSIKICVEWNVLWLILLSFSVISSSPLLVFFSHLLFLFPDYPSFFSLSILLLLSFIFLSECNAEAKRIVLTRRVILLEWYL